MAMMWWGYLHSNGKLQLKRWFGDHEDYRGDCIGNPFVQKVCPPFEADTYESAWAYLKTKLEVTK